MFTAEDKLKCALRELKMRRAVYPRRIQLQQMHAATAEHEIAVMEEIAKDYEQQVEKERLI